MGIVLGESTAVGKGAGSVAKISKADRKLALRAQAKRKARYAGNGSRTEAQVERPGRATGP